MSISGSVGYDPLKKMVYARCAGLAPNVATLKVVTDVILLSKVDVLLYDDNMKLKKYKYGNLSTIQKNGIYGRTIKRCIEDSDFLVSTYKQLIVNIAKINKNGNVKESGYWRAAFNYKNGKCHPPTKDNSM